MEFVLCDNLNLLKDNKGQSKGFTFIEMKLEY